MEGPNESITSFCNSNYISNKGNGLNGFLSWTLCLQHWNHNNSKALVIKYCLAFLKQPGERWDNFSFAIREKPFPLLIMCILGGEEKRFTGHKLNRQWEWKAIAENIKVEFGIQLTNGSSLCMRFEDDDWRQFTLNWCWQVRESRNVKQLLKH